MKEKKKHLLELFTDQYMRSHNIKGQLIMSQPVLRNKTWANSWNNLFCPNQVCYMFINVCNGFFSFIHHMVLKWTLDILYWLIIFECFSQICLTLSLNECWTLQLLAHMANNFNKSVLFHTSFREWLFCTNINLSTMIFSLCILCGKGRL